MTGDTLIACVHFNMVDAVQEERAITALAMAMPEVPLDLLLYCNNAQLELLTARLLAPCYAHGGEVTVVMDPLQRTPPKTHPYTVNQVMAYAERHGYHHVLFTRTDYLLVDGAIEALMREYRDTMDPGEVDPFVSGWVYQTAYDREQRDFPEPNYDGVRWRKHGVKAIIDGGIPGYRFDETHLDAGIWITSVRNWRTLARPNEQLASWGYAQSTWQRALFNKGVPFYVLSQYVAVHQWHGIWARDHQKARQEYEQFGEGV